MRFINTLKVGDRLRDIYGVKSKKTAMTKNGKEYYSVVLFDKTKEVDCKIWDTSSPGIDDFSMGDMVEVTGEVKEFNGMIQVNAERIRVCSESEYELSNYIRTSSRDIDEMYNELLGLIDTVKNHDLKALMDKFFREDEEFIKKFKYRAAAKSVHHAFMGGLLEHSLSVANLANMVAKHYDFLKRDTLLCAAILHDIGKVKEISDFPMSDYTEEGQFLGHLVIGLEMVDEKIKELPGFNQKLANEIRHCIVSHHGSLEFGAAKVPCTAEAMALHMIDDIDAKLEQFKENLESLTDGEWTDYNKFLGTKIKKSTETE